MNGQQQQNAFVLVLLADAPFPEQVIGEVFNRVSPQAGYGDHRNLRPSGTLHALTIVFQLKAGAVVEYTREVTDITLGSKILTEREPYGDEE